MTAEDEVRRLCAALWPGQAVREWPETRSVLVRGKRRPQSMVVAYSVAVGRSMLSAGVELGRGCIATYAWEAALDALPQMFGARVVEIDRETAAMAEERARIVAAMEVKP